MNKEALKYVLRQFHESGPPPTRARHLELPLTTNKVILLRGIRRSGKTSLFFHTLSRLEASGIDRRRLIYLNLEDDRLFPFGVEAMDLILQAHAELFPDAQAQRRYLFLDEIQAVPGWERYARRVLDAESVSLFVTGSAPALLGRALAPVLRGRGLCYELLPLGFAESLRFLGIEASPYSKRSEAVAAHALADYLRWGGFPEILLAPEPLRRKIITEYADTLYYRDLLDQFSIRNEHVMRSLLKHCLSHPATLLSPHKFYHDFRSQGIRVSKNTLYDYLRFLEEAGVVFFIPKFARSIRVQEQNPKKCFLVDLGLMQAFTAEPDKDQGRKLENLVFLKMRERGGELFYYAEGQEVDLVHRTPGSLALTNVCWSLDSPEVVRREINGLVAAGKTLPKAEQQLISQERSAPVPGHIQAIPALRYLLEGRLGESQHSQ